MRHVFASAIVGGLLLATASAAHAQSSDALKNCRRVGQMNAIGYIGPDPKNEADLLARVGVVIECDDTRIFAEEIRVTPTKIFASGNLLVQQEGLRVNADRMEMDRETHLGVFYQAYGTARLTDQQPNRDLFGTMEPEVAFRAERIERLGPRMYKLTNGAFTTCVQPNPRWEMRGTSGTIILGDYATLRNVGFFVKGIPVLYIPYLYYPLKKEDRATGFLIPNYSYSKVRGHGVSTAFFWAINRSQDATLYYDAFSQSGQGFGADYRYAAAPGSQGDFRIYALYEKDRLLPNGAIERPAHREYDLRGSVNHGLPGGFRLIGQVNYFSDIVTQQLYQQNVYDLTRSQRNVTFSLTGNLRARNTAIARIDASFRQQDLFTSALSASRLGRTPQVNVWFSDRELFKNSRVYYGGFAEAAYITSRPSLTNSALDRSLWRLDARPVIRATPTRWDFLSVSTTAAFRLTRWLESLDPLTLAPVPVPLTRALIDLQASIVGPRFQKTWDTPKGGYASRFRHIITPNVTVQWLSPFEKSSQVIVTDPSVDSLVGGTTSVTYSLDNTILAKVRTTGMPRPLFSVNVGQTYYSNPLAGAVDPQYPMQMVGTYTPVYVTAVLSPTNEVNARFQMAYNTKAGAVQSYTTQTTIHVKNLDLMGGWQRVLEIPGVSSFSSSFINATANVRLREGRFQGGYGFNFDLTRNAFMQQRFMVALNAQCCGIALDYQTINIGHVGLSSVATDRRFGVSFTLAGIGSFSNPFGSFRQ